MFKNTFKHLAKHSKVVSKVWLIISECLDKLYTRERVREPITEGHTALLGILAGQSPKLTVQHMVRYKESCTLLCLFGKCFPNV